MRKMINTTALVLFLLAANPQQPPQISATRVISLDEAVQQARKGNPALAASKEKVVQSAQWKRRALAAFLPQWMISANYYRLSIDYNFGYEIKLPAPYPVVKGRFPFDLNRDNVTSIGSTLNVPIFNLSSFAKYFMASNQAEAADRTSRAYENEFVYNVVSAYYATLGAKKILDIVREGLLSAQAHFTTAKARFDSGDIQKLALIKAEYETVKAEQDMRRAENAYSSAREALALLMGTDASFDVADASDVTLKPYP
ncbi:MAG: TolC family protein [Myxococcota bacterium]|jgi:outer membrane protein TolC